MAIELGSKVWVMAMGSYYAGEVVKLTSKRASVRYKSGAGVEREKALPFNAATGGWNDKYAERYPLVEIMEGVAAPKGPRATPPAERGPNVYERACARRENERS